ncbi:Polysaccharide pyruvyl transferase [Roseivivax marinus]|uniref:polysaccharide pyruvyl transferase family protein n=1 Tax=Roseivivax marinus TaxID=1379903 RepID=UPI0008D7A767|nr:polysaccharide pyruvyl transferase family protein [Roseivivax marinus]SEL08082.1 Polysaccharide pyruvyl transferase [Roseivivax marinus]
MSTPLKLFWYAREANFGDALSGIVTAFASGREVVHADPKSAEVFAVGSILQIVRRTHPEGRAGGDRPWVWGSGTLKPIRLDFVPHVRFAALRGPITESLLGVDVNGVYGDPGLLVADALGDRPEREDRVGLVPHLAHVDGPEVAALLKADPRLKLIDVRQDAATVCREIGACAHVLSSSLHGLVVADAYGVPNTWLDPAGIHKSPRLKFYDYAAGIGRALPRPLSFAEVPEHLPRLPDTAPSYADGIAAAKAGLLDAFPAELRRERAA